MVSCLLPTLTATVILKMRKSIRSLVADIGLRSNGDSVGQLIERRGLGVLESSRDFPMGQLAEINKSSLAELEMISVADLVALLGGLGDLREVGAHADGPSCRSDHMFHHLNIFNLYTQHILSINTPSLNIKNTIHGPKYYKL